MLLNLDPDAPNEIWTRRGPKQSSLDYDDWNTLCPSVLADKSARRRDEDELVDLHPKPGRELKEAACAFFLLWDG